MSLTLSLVNVEIVVTAVCAAEMVCRSDNTAFYSLNLNESHASINFAGKTRSETIHTDVSVYGNVCGPFFHGCICTESGIIEPD